MVIGPTQNTRLAVMNPSSKWASASPEVILRRQSKLQPYDHRHQAEPGHDGFAHPFRQPVPQERPEPAAREDGAHVDQSARGNQWLFPVFTS